MSSDALSSLRSAIKSKSDITFLNGINTSDTLSGATHIVLESDTYPKNAPTRFRVQRADPGAPLKDPETNPTEFYSLEALYLAWQLRASSVAEYMKQVRENGVSSGFVSVTDRKGVVDWLEGRIKRHDNVVPSLTDSSTPPGTPSLSNAALPNTPGQPGSAQTSPSKRRYVPDASDVDTVKKIKQNEVELRDRNTVLRGIKPNNFTSIRNVYTEKLRKLREAPKTSASASAAQPKSDPKAQMRRSRNMYPIIMISSSPTSLITMHNVKRFLQDAIFEPSTDARARAASEGNTRHEDLIAIYRRRTHIDPSGQERESHARYSVVDGVEALSKFGNDAWDRVVCVLTTGQAWQFRPYKWTEPRALFHHVKGFYVSWTNDPPNPKIKDWNVTELKIDPHRRHVDKSVVAHFWKTLDTWTAANKPWLMKS